MTAIVTDAHYRMSVSLIRDLFDRGVRVAACEKASIEAPVGFAGRGAAQCVRLPDEEYEFGDFLMRAVGAAKQAAQRPIHLEAGADLRRMGEELQKLDKAFLVLLICERIKSFLQGGGNLGELAFVSAFWREFAAAVILYLLEQTDPHHLYQ